VRGTGVDTRRADLREKYDGPGMVVGLAEEGPELAVADDATGLADVGFLGVEARLKDQGGMKPMLDLRCLVSVVGPVTIGVISGSAVPEDLRVLSDVFWNGLDKDNEGRGELLEESDSMADSRHVSRV